MNDFYHAPGCCCGNCWAIPAMATEETVDEYDCGCLFDDGDMYFCADHEPNDPEPDHGSESDREDAP